MKEHGGRSAVSAQVAALETRRAKQDVNADRLREQWRARASEHGLTSEKAAQILTPGERALPLPNPVSPEILTDEVSVFGRAELLQRLAEAQPRGANVSALEQLADVTLGDRELVKLPAGPAPAGLREPRFTTRELLATEQDLLDRATSSLDGTRGWVPGRAVGKAVAGRTLSDEQRHVVEELCCRGDGVAVLRAPAGTGKTFVLDAAREAWAGDGVEVAGCALSARAALELSDQAAIPSVTIAQLTGNLESGAMRLPDRGVLVVDEAGMVGTRDLARLADAAEQTGTKLVLVGDDRQLPEIQAGGAFHALAERLPTSELREVRRQREAWDRQALDALRSGEVEQWARAYRARGQITVGENAPATRAALVNDWSRADGDRLMIAARREDVRDLNERAREFLQHDGRLGPDELFVADRAFATGDRVIGVKNDRRAGILNGQRGTVTAADAETRSLAVTLDGGEAVTLGPGYLDAGHLEHGYAITAHRAQGATVDRTFVLGSEELYRQWGYTAMSRHREEARFYIARGDLHADPELPPPGDPLIAGIGALLSRTRTKELALDSLPDEERGELERERHTLRESLADDPPARDGHRALDERLEWQSRALEKAHEREELLRKKREELGWHQRKARATRDRDIVTNLSEQDTWREAIQETEAAISAATTADATWIEHHGPRGLRLVVVNRELRGRDIAEARATHRLEGLDHNPLVPEPPALDLGMDMGL